METPPRMTPAATGSARGRALATQSNLDFDAVRAAENAIRAPRELRFGSPPPPQQQRAGDDATAQMARRFDRARQKRMVLSPLELRSIPAYMMML